MGDSLHKPRMVEPTDPAERAAAIRICRLNSWCHPETGAPMDVSDPEIRAEHRRMWNDPKNDLPYAKWIWMWNEGRDEWAFHANPEVK